MTDSADIIERAVEPFFNPILRDYIETVRKNHDQIIDNINIDSQKYYLREYERPR